MFSHWSRPKPNASEGGWVIYSYLQEILLITPVVLDYPWNFNIFSQLLLLSGETVEKVIYFQLWVAQTFARNCQLCFKIDTFGSTRNPYKYKTAMNTNSKDQKFPKITGWVGFPLSNAIMRGSHEGRERQSQEGPKGLKLKVGAQRPLA